MKMFDILKKFRKLAQNPHKLKTEESFILRKLKS